MHTFDFPQVAAEVNVSTTDEPLSASDIVPVFTKAKNRHHFAALLVCSLFDEETRMHSNVRGRGKEMLDPMIIQ